MLHQNDMIIHHIETMRANQNTALRMGLLPDHPCAHDMRAFDRFEFVAMNTTHIRMQVARKEMARRAENIAKARATARGAVASATVATAAGPAAAAPGTGTAASGKEPGDEAADTASGSEAADSALVVAAAATAAAAAVAKVEPRRQRELSSDEVVKKRVERVRRALHEYQEKVSSTVLKFSPEEDWDLEDQREVSYLNAVSQRFHEVMGTPPDLLLCAASAGLTDKTCALRYRRHLAAKAAAAKAVAAKEAAAKEAAAKNGDKEAHASAGAGAAPEEEDASAAATSADATAPEAPGAGASASAGASTAPTSVALAQAAPSASAGSGTDTNLALGPAGAAAAAAAAADDDEEDDDDEDHWRSLLSVSQALEKVQEATKELLLSVHSPTLSVYDCDKILDAAGQGVDFLDALVCSRSQTRRLLDADGCSVCGRSVGQLGLLLGDLDTRLTLFRMWHAVRDPYALVTRLAHAAVVRRESRQQQKQQQQQTQTQREERLQGQQQQQGQETETAAAAVVVEGGSRRRGGSGSLCSGRGDGNGETVADDDVLAASTSGSVSTSAVAAAASGQRRSGTASDDGISVAAAQSACAAGSGGPSLPPGALDGLTSVGSSRTASTAHSAGPSDTHDANSLALDAEGGAGGPGGAPSGEGAPFGDAGAGQMAPVESSGSGSEPDDDIAPSEFLDWATGVRMLKPATIGWWLLGRQQETVADADGSRKASATATATAAAAGGGGSAGGRILTRRDLRIALRLAALLDEMCSAVLGYALAKDDDGTSREDEGVRRRVAALDSLLSVESGASADDVVAFNTRRCRFMDMVLAWQVAQNQNTTEPYVVEDMASTAVDFFRGAMGSGTVPRAAGPLPPEVLQRSGADAARARVVHESRAWVAAISSRLPAMAAHFVEAAERFIAMSELVRVLQGQPHTAHAAINHTANTAKRTLQSVRLIALESVKSGSSGPALMPGAPPTVCPVEMPLLAGSGAGADDDACGGGGVDAAAQANPYLMLLRWRRARIVESSRGGSTFSDDFPLPLLVDSSDPRVTAATVYLTVLRTAADKRLAGGMDRIKVAALPRAGPDGSFDPKRDAFRGSQGSPPHLLLQLTKREPVRGAKIAPTKVEGGEDFFGQVYEAASAPLSTKAQRPPLVLEIAGADALHTALAALALAHQKAVTVQGGDRELFLLVGLPDRTATAALAPPNPPGTSTSSSASQESAAAKAAGKARSAAGAGRGRAGGGGAKQGSDGAAAGSGAGKYPETRALAALLRELAGSPRTVLAPGSADRGVLAEQLVRWGQAAEWEELPLRLVVAWESSRAETRKGLQINATRSRP